MQRKCRCAVGDLSTDFRSCEGETFFLKKCNLTARVGRLIFDVLRFLVDMREFMLLATRTEIRHISLDPKATSQAYDVNTTFINALGVDFHYDKKMIFFTGLCTSFWFVSDNLDFGKATCTFLTLNCHDYF